MEGMHLRRDAARPTHMLRGNWKPRQNPKRNSYGTIIWLDGSLIFFAAVAPLGVWYRGSRGREGRTHLRGGEGCCLPEPCRAPQFGATPLHRAANGGHAAVVEQLLAAGAAVDAKDEVRGGVGGDRRELGGRTQLCVSSWFLCFVFLRFRISARLQNK